MARTFARFCLWTILCLSQSSIPWASANEIDYRDLTFDEMIGSYNPARQQDLFRSLQSTRCDLLPDNLQNSHLQNSDLQNSHLQNSHLASSHPQNSPIPNTPVSIAEYDLPPKPRIRPANPLRATCPAEFFTAKTESNESLEPGSMFGFNWIKAWNVASNLTGQVYETRHFIKRTLNDSTKQLENDLVLAKTYIKLRLVPSFIRAASNRIPYSPVSYTKTTVDVPDSVETRPIEDLECDCKGDGRAIQLDDSADPYWQYYEDCDRWGVEFAAPVDDMPSPESRIKTSESDTIEHQLDSNNTARTNILDGSWNEIHQLISNFANDINCRSTNAWQLTLTRPWVANLEFHAVETESVELGTLEIESPFDVTEAVFTQIQTAVRESSFRIRQSVQRLDHTISHHLATQFRRSANHIGYFIGSASPELIQVVSLRWSPRIIGESPVNVLRSTQ